MLVFHLKARSAAYEGDKYSANEHKKTSFAFTIFAIIGWIIVVCVAIFIAYVHYCGLTGQFCDPLKTSSN